MAEMTEYELKMLMDADPNIVSMIDPRSYTALYQNKTGRVKLGVLTGRTCYKTIPKLEAVCPFCKMPEAMRTGERQSSEVQLPDGTWLLVQFSPIKRSDGRVDIVETITDISDIKKREEELKKTVALLLERDAEIEKLKEKAP